MSNDPSVNESAKAPTVPTITRKVVPNDAPSVVACEGVHLSFPLVRFKARGIKEGLLELVRRPKTGFDKRAFWALRGVSMQVRRGEIVGIVGRNGSGKSTLLRVFCGIYRPDRGSVQLPTGRVAALLELGSGFRDELSGLENIRLSCSIQGFSSREIDERIDPIVKFAELEEFIDQPIRTYSSGMRARLGFAVASVIEPEVLLVDEVLAVGDASFRQKCMQRIEQLVAGDTTVVIVSHNSPELRRLCSRLVLLDRGQVVLDGDVDEVLARYQSMTGAS